MQLMVASDRDSRITEECRLPVHKDELIDRLVRVRVEVGVVIDLIG